MPTGIPIARKGLWTAEEKAQLRELYGKVRVKEIARRLGRSRAGIHQQACTRMGLVSAGKKRFIAETKVKYYYNRHFFTTVNEDSAYWAGFLAADGCLCPGRRTVQVYLGTRDRGHLEKLAASLGYNGPIVDSKTTNDFAPNGAALSRITLCHAQQMIEDLRQNFRITPRKTYTLEPPDLPLPFARHFLRGLVDGDGAIYRDSRNRLCLTVRGTIPVLEWMRLLVDRVCPHVRASRVRCYAGHPLYCVSASRAEKLYVWLYSDAHTSLDRKRVFLDELLPKGDE
jgi:hypothetical protein